MSDILDRLDSIIRQRFNETDSTSWVATLHKKGIDASLKKVGEEATEVVIAAKSESDEALANESADLVFHLLIVLAERGLSSKDVLAVLEDRFGQSGIEEKANRNK